MARKPRRRRMGRYIKGGIDDVLSLGTLAGKTLIGTVFDEVVRERTLVSSIVATYSISDLTLGAGIGPVLVGIAHSDYSDAEIEAVIEMTDSWDEGNKTEQELAKRLVRRIGIFEVSASGEDAVLNDGVPIKTKLNWILNSAQSLRLWAYNMGANPLATTVPLVSLQGHANLWPR